MKSKIVVTSLCVCLFTLAACHSAGSGSNYDSTTTQADTMTTQPANTDSTHSSIDSANNKIDTTKTPK